MIPVNNELGSCGGTGVALKYQKKDNYKIYGTKVDGGINVKDISLKRKYALVIGNEGNGVSEEVNNLCDEYLYIKMNKEVESLNAGVATSILLYEMDDKYDIN